MRALMIIAVMVVFLLGGWSAVTFKSPLIESDIDARAERAVAPFATHPVRVDTNGRHISLRGIADDAEHRGQLMAAAREATGMVGLIDRIRVLEVASPYVFTAMRDEDGRISLAGVVPSEAAREALVQRARAQAGTKPVRTNLALAAGAPSDAWIDMAAAGIEALIPLERGIARLSDADGSLSGVANGVAAREATLLILASDRAGNWQSEFDLILPVASPYRFTATKQPGSFTWRGDAPDERTMARLAERAEALGGTGAAGEMTLSAGMPDPIWPETVERGLGSLALMSSGTLTVEDQAVSLTGEVKTSDDLARLEATLGDDWTINVAVLSPDPASKLKISLGSGGKTVFSGRLPKQFDTAHLTSLFPGGSVEAIEADGTGDTAVWINVVDALAVIAPRLRSAEAVLSDGQVTLTGVLKREFKATEARAAINAAMPANWQSVIRISDAPPFPRITLTKTTEGIALGGILPTGLDPAEASARTNAGLTDLETGGDGAATGWPDALSAAAMIATAYDQVEITLAAGAATAAGTLSSGQTLSEVEAWSSSAFPEGWTLALSGSETPADDGTVRYNFRSDEFEVLTRGYWLPDLEFAASPAQCGAATQSALDLEKITFVTGSTEIDARAQEVLNRLASIAMRCVNETNLRLEIAGHTDDVGPDDPNLALSEQRALAVMSALLARGVAGAGLSAIGYGETQPIGSNTTQDGRAGNRRIDFRFTE